MFFGQVWLKTIDVKKVKTKKSVVLFHQFITKIKFANNLSILDLACKLNVPLSAKFNHRIPKLYLKFSHGGSFPSNYGKRSEIQMFTKTVLPLSDFRFLEHLYFSWLQLPLPFEKVVGSLVKTIGF